MEAKEKQYILRWKIKVFAKQNKNSITVKKSRTFDKETRILKSRYF